MQLEITKELLKYTFGYTPQLDVNEKYPLGMKVIYMPTAYLFDTDTYLLFVKDSDEAGYLTDTIPFPIVKQHEAMHAYIDSINNKRIAADLGLKPNTVDKKISRGLKKLKEILMKEAEE